MFRHIVCENFQYSYFLRELVQIQFKPKFKKETHRSSFSTKNPFFIFLYRIFFFKIPLILFQESNTFGILKKKRFHKLREGSPLFRLQKEQKSGRENLPLFQKENTRMSGITKILLINRS